MFSQASVILFMGGGHTWRGGRAWLERRPLQRMVRILLECILVGAFFQELKSTKTERLSFVMKV